MSEQELLEVIEKQQKTIKNYETLLEQGRLLILPCVLGTPLWFVYKHNSKWCVRSTKLYWDNAKRVVEGFGRIFFQNENEAIMRKDELNGVVNVHLFNSI
jgi:hypothetical protein